MNIEVRTFPFRSEFPALTRNRFQVIIRHLAMRGDIHADLFPEATITIELP